MEHSVTAAVVRRRIAIVVFGVLAVFLFSSEVMNSFFNNQLDAVGADFAMRGRLSFKPTVVALFIVFATILYLLIIRYLRPLFAFLNDGTHYDDARKAAINVPRDIIIFQLVAWTIGTTLYYWLNDWQGATGIPFGFGLPLKLAVGLPSGVYISILFNLILVPVKRSLGIERLDEGENDRFSRNRDYYVVAAIIVFMVVNYSYLAYYYNRAEIPVTFAGFYTPLLILTIFYSAVSFGLIALSRREYHIQIESIRLILEQMAIGRANLETRIAIINYNELGEIAGFANGILDNFVGILDKISETSTTLQSSSETLSSASRQNASYANEQASSTTEIVRTMEEVDALSKEIGTRSREVEQLALDMNNQIDRGVTAITRTMETMGAVKRSNAETIAEMRNLTEQINSIWEVVKIINGIAGQIKIIAFNATLEAASAGEAGKNFEIVASEIRRLADNTVASTSEIRSMIERIQGAADAMVLSSEDDTRQIAAAWDLSSQQETAFGALQKLSASTSGVAQEMHRDVSQQINAYGQVLETLKQISTGVGEFSDSIEETSDTAERIRTTVTTLNTIVEETGSVAEDVPPTAAAPTAT
jgi:methyl-accepting chemotaxis protein